MHSYLISVYSTAVRSSRLALALLLVKLSTELSLPVLPTLFGIKHGACSKAIHSARQALMADCAKVYRIWPCGHGKKSLKTTHQHLLKLSSVVTEMM